jgi:hypothetical protein
MTTLFRARAAVYSLILREEGRCVAEIAEGKEEIDVGELQSMANRGAHGLRPLLTKLTPEGQESLEGLSIEVLDLGHGVH